MTNRKSDTFTLLSRPPRFSTTAQRKYHTGLPINSLPGWELIPLNSKLPMLRCPNNQVIFSTHKIGQPIKRPAQEFTSIILEKMPEYRPLEDNHLREFFKRTETLKLLRINGEITENNDIICTLKDFNQFRRELDRYTRKVEKALQPKIDRHNRMLMDRAEAVADNQYYRAQLLCNTKDIKARRLTLERIRQERYERNWQHILNRIEKFEKRRELERDAWRQRKLLHSLNIEHHRQAVIEMARRQSIKYKIFTRIKILRTNNVLAMEKKRRIRALYDRLQNSWEKRLEERITNGRYLDDLVHDMHNQRQERVAKHIQRHKNLWDRLEQELFKRTRSNWIAKNKKLKKKFKNKKNKVGRKPAEELPITFGTKYVNFDELLDKDLIKMLENLEMQENYSLTFHTSDPLYKMAEFLKRHIIRKFREDLSDNFELLCSLKSRLVNFVLSLKEKLMTNAERIIKVSRIDALRSPTVEYKSIGKCKSDEKCVQFATETNLILGESYKIHSEVELASVQNRSPTPKASLASILMDPKAVLNLGTEYELLKRRQLIYVEYCFAKYKQAVLVGVEGRVLNAIRLHFKGKSVQVQPELLDISEYYMIDEIARAILSSAVNQINFQSSVFFGITMLSNKILYMLQPILNDCGCGQANESRQLITHVCFLQHLYNIPDSSKAASVDSLH